MHSKKDYELKEAKWLENIPDDWKAFRLKDLIEISPTFSDGGPKNGDKCSVIPMDIVSEKGSFYEYEIEDYELIPEGLTAFQEGDVIFAKITPCMENGKGAFVKVLKTKYAFGSTEFHVLRPKNNLDGKFLYYYTYNPEYRKYAAENMTGAAGQKRVSTRFMQYTPIFLPSLNEQINIASYLSTQCKKIDKAIDLKKNQLNVLDELCKSIIHKAITKGLDENIKLVDSGNYLVGKIPVHWRIDRLKDLTLKIGSGITPTGGATVYVDEGIPFLRSQNIHFNGLHLEDVAFITEEQHSIMPNTHLKEGDVLLNITGASVGRCYYVSKNLCPANVNQHVCIIRPSSKLFTKYLYYYLRSDIGQDLISISYKGASREGLTSRELMSFVVPLPPFDEQELIANYLDNKCSKLETLEKSINDQIKTLEQYQESLIHECITGKRRVLEKDLKELVNV